MDNFSHEPQNNLQDGHPDTLGPSTNGQRGSSGSKDQHVQRSMPGSEPRGIPADSDEDFERQFRRASPYNLR